MAKPPDILRRRQVIEAPRSPTPDPPKPGFPDEQPTKPANVEASRWRMISNVLPALDGKGLAILEAVAAALADMPPTESEPLIQRYDRMDERQRHVLAAVVHALAGSGGVR